MNTIEDMLAIDVHGHIGRCTQLNTPELKAEWMSGDAAMVLSRAKAANIRFTVVSPLLALFPRGRADTVAGNLEAVQMVDTAEGLLQWVVLNPLQPATVEQARNMLRQPKCVGIKIHPEEHGYRIAEQGRAIFEFAAEMRAVVLTHSGESNSLPNDFVPFSNEYPEVTLILAHLGNSGDTENNSELQVRAIQAARHGNIYTDTSSAQSILPGLIEWAVAEVGAERILFGTDTPLYFSPSQRARINHADLSEAQKRLILLENARRILTIPEDF